MKPGERKKVPTGIKSYFDRKEVLLLIVRSSMGFKYNIRLCNQVGVIDSDYYNNKDNEGHIWLMTQNDLAEKMNVTDKAVSKWERNLSCPDVNSIPKLAKILGISVEELLNAQKNKTIAK